MKQNINNKGESSMSRNKYNPQRVDMARSIVINNVALSSVVARYGIHQYKDRIVCPFHADDTPSCFVSDELKTYHCFGCHAKGTVVEFVRDYERAYGSDEVYSQVKAIVKLARQFDVEIPDLEDKTLIKPEKKVRVKRELDTGRIIAKKIQQIEQKTKGMQDKEKRLKLYSVLDDYYFGKVLGEDALIQMKGVLNKDE